MKLLKKWKMSSTSILSAAGIGALVLLLMSCSGSPPVMERKIKLYDGTPSQIAMCRVTQAQAVAFAKKVLQSDISKFYAKDAISASLKADAPALECIKANSAEFAQLAGITFDDLRVILQYQENLLYKCAKWDP